MGLFGSLGKSISKGAAAGSHSALGPIGGLLGGVGGAVQGLFGGHRASGLMGQQNLFGMQNQASPLDPNDPDYQRKLMMAKLMGKEGLF